MLLGIKALSALLYRFDVHWIGKRPSDPWENLRLVVLLNHTSLYEPLAYSGGRHHVQIPSQLIPKLFKTLNMQIAPGER